MVTILAMLIDSMLGGNQGEFIISLLCMPIFVIYYYGVRTGLLINTAALAIFYAVALLNPSWAYAYPEPLLKLLPVIYAMLCGQGVVIRYGCSSFAAASCT